MANTNASTSRVPTITVYAPGASSPSRTISDGLIDPVTIHADSSGNLGVLNSYYNGNGPNIAMYASGASSPSSVITQGVDAPSSFAFDQSNNLYVDNGGATYSDPGSITVYAAGNYSLTRTITKNIDHSESLAVGP